MHTSSLARYTRNKMLELIHENGSKVCVLYGRNVEEGIDQIRPNIGPQMQKPFLSTQSQFQLLSPQQQQQYLAQAQVQGNLINSPNFGDMDPRRFRSLPRGNLSGKDGQPAVTDGSVGSPMQTNSPKVRPDQAEYLMKPSYCLNTFSGHGSQVTSVDFHPKKTDLLCSCDGNGEIRYWNVNQYNCTRAFKPPCCQSSQGSCGIGGICKDCTTCFLQSDLQDGRPSTSQFREKLPWFLKALPSANCAKGGNGAYTSSVDLTG